MKRAKLIFITAIVVIFILIVCGKWRANKIKIETSSQCYAVNVAYSAQPFWKDTQKTIQEIQNTNSTISFVFGGPSNADVNKQIEEIESLITRKVNGIILFPADPKALIPIINKAVENQIPVVTLFSDVVGSKRMSFVGAPEKESGMLLAKMVLDNHPDFSKAKTKILISFNKPGETVTDARLAGIKEALESPEYNQTVEVIQIVNDYGDDAKAAEAIAPILEKHKDIKVIFGLNARSAIGAIAAIKEKKKSNGESYKPGDIIITAWDSDADVLNHIQDGWIYATSVLNTVLCTQTAFQILYTKEAESKEVLIPEILVTKENVSSFIQKK
jgi:ribose transport system substrate-binding protein